MRILTNRARSVYENRKAGKILFSETIVDFSILPEANKELYPLHIFDRLDLIILSVSGCNPKCKFIKNFAGKDCDFAPDFSKTRVFLTD